MPSELMTYESLVGQHAPWASVCGLGTREIRGEGQKIGNQSPDSTLGLPEPQFPHLSSEEHSWPISHPVRMSQRGDARAGASQAEASCRPQGLVFLNLAVHLNSCDGGLAPGRTSTAPAGSQGRFRSFPGLPTLATSWEWSFINFPLNSVPQGCGFSNGQGRGF